MTLETIDIETAAHPSASIIVLHGLGADGNDFVPFARELDLHTIGAVRFVFPHAPARPVTVNGGHVMRAWYDIFSADLVRREDEGGLRTSQGQIDALIAREGARGVPAEKIVLAGFSQGCAAALLTGLRHPQRLAGIAGLSGYLPLADKTAQEASAANQALPIFMGHGRSDTVIPIHRALASRDALSALGYPVEWHEYPMPHSVCAEEVADLNRWLLARLS